MAKLDRSLFLKEVKTSFPELVSKINSEQGLLHFEMDIVRKFAQHLIDTQQHDNLKKCFLIIEKFYLSGNNKLKNTIDVSFIELLDFKKTKHYNREWAWELLPDSLKKLYTRFHVDFMDYVPPTKRCKG